MLFDTYSRIYRSCISIHKSLVLDGSLHYVQCVPCAEILQIFLLFSMIWNCRIPSPAVSKQWDERWCGFRYSIPISIGYLWNSCIDTVISTPSCSYCIWNRYWQNHRSILPNFLLFAWFDTLEFNRLPWSNIKIYNDAVFADWFAIIWLCLECVYWYGYLDSLILILRMK